MILVLRGWITVLVLSLLISLFGVNQGIVFLGIYTFFLVVSYLALFRSLKYTNPVLGLFNTKIESKGIAISIFRAILVYIVAFAVSKWLCFDFYKAFEATTFVAALFINLF